RLYASALPPKNAPPKREDGSGAAPSPPADESDGVHKLATSPNSTRSNEVLEASRRTSNNSSELPLLAMANLSLEAYGSSSDSTSSTSSTTGGSFYRGEVAGQTPTRLTNDLRRPPPGVHPHRTQSQPASLTSTSSNTPSVNHHRASTIATSASATMYTKPYSYTPPTELPNRILVARPPSHGHVSQVSTSAVGQGSWQTGSLHSLPPTPPSKPSSIGTSYSPIPHPQSGGNYGSSLSGFASPSQFPNNVSQAASPPIPSTTFTQPQYMSSAATTLTSPQTPLTPPFTPPMQNSTTPIASTSTSTGNALLSAAGKAALKFVGSAVLGSVFGTLTPDSLFSGLAGSVLDGGMLDALTSSLAKLNLNTAGLDLGQFQAAFQGVPGTDYQSIMNSIVQQQQVSPSLGVDYKVILDALMKIQKAQAQAMLNQNGGGGNGLGLGGNQVAAHQATPNQSQQQIQGLMNAIQQQAAQNAQLLQQQIQQIQASAQANTSSQVQNYLQAAYQQQLAMNASASQQPQQQQQQTQSQTPSQPQQQHVAHHHVSVNASTGVSTQQQHSQTLHHPPPSPQYSTHSGHQNSLSSSTHYSQLHHQSTAQNHHTVVTQPALSPHRPSHSMTSPQPISPASSVSSHHQPLRPPHHHANTQPLPSTSSVPPRPTSYQAPAQNHQPPRPQSHQQPPRPQSYQQPPRPQSYLQPPQTSQQQQPPRPPLQHAHSTSNLQQPPRPPLAQQPSSSPAVPHYQQQQQPPRPPTQYQQPQQQQQSSHLQQQQAQQAQYQQQQQAQQAQYHHHHQQQQQQAQYQQQQAQYQQQQQQSQYQQEQSQPAQDQSSYYDSPNSNPSYDQQQEAFSPYNDPGSGSSGFSPETIPDYSLTPESSSGGEETSPPSFTSILGNAFDLGTQLMNSYANNSGSTGGEAPGYTLTNEGADNGGEAGGGGGGGLTSFFDGVMSYAGSMDLGNTNFDIGATFNASITVGDESAPEYC
ncbi:hypothetical protein V5O48_011466, partial [Marasmius crinis-equi]